MKRVSKLDIKEVRSGMRLAQTIYMGGRVVLLESGQIITADHLKRLLRSEIQTVIVEDESPEQETSAAPVEKAEKDDSFAEMDFVFQHLSSLKPGTELTREQVEKERQLHKGFKKSHQNLEMVIRTTFEEILHRNTLNIDSVSTAVEQLIEELENEMNIRQRQTSISFEDDYIYRHSVNVAVYSLIIGLSLKLEKEELVELGISALLHDVGMLKVPEEIRCKSQKLSEKEYDEIKKHCSYGRGILEKFPQLSLRIIDGVAQHHERMDGQGYPDGLTRDGISPFARIIAICDTFDSLSSPRFHHNAMQKHEALKMCLEMCEKSFDERYLEKLLHNLPLYPVGSRVKLNNGEVGLVSQTTSNPFRPCVDIIEKNDSQSDQKRRVDLTLQKNSIFEITEVLESAAEEYT